MSPLHATLFFLLCFGFASIGAGVDSLSARILPFWFAVSFAFSGIAYSGVGPRLLGKRIDGTRPLWLWIPFGPYFATSYFSLWLIRAIGVRAWAQVTPTVYLGRKLTNEEGSRVEWAGVLDLAAEFPEAPSLRRVPQYFSIPLLDATAPSVEQLRSAVDWLKSVAERGPVFVHCAAGHGRSATVVVAYLIAVGEAENVEAGEALLRTLRPGVKLRRSQIAAVRALQAEIDSNLA